MSCPDPLLVQAYADGELDAEAVLRLDAHLEGCAACAKLNRAAAAVGPVIRAHATRHRLSVERRTALLAGVRAASGAAGEPPTQRPARRSRAWHYWTGTASGAIAAGILALTIGGLLVRGNSDPVVNDLVGAHIRSLLSDRLIDVESSDRHTVKPWFAGHADVSPPVVDFTEQNYRLVGGRVDYVDGRRAAVVVYRHGAHVINVFAWPDSGARLPGGVASRNGYNLACWKNDSVDFCAASDAVGEELLGLTRLLKPLTATVPRE